MEAVLQGRNGSVFCYGATGAGKTYTMLGTVENPGVMVLAIKDLFTKIRQRSCDGNHVVHLSYLEVYNETVRDLLAPGRPLVLREDKQVCFLFRHFSWMIQKNIYYIFAFVCCFVDHFSHRNNLNDKLRQKWFKYIAGDCSSRSYSIQSLFYRWGNFLIPF